MSGPRTPVTGEHPTVEQPPTNGVDQPAGTRAGVFIVPIPGAKSRKHIDENVRAADIVLTAEDLAEIDRIVPPGAASGTRYPVGQLHRVNV
jgi:hypothetical protein